MFFQHILSFVIIYPQLLPWRAYSVIGKKETSVLLLILLWDTISMSSLDSLLNGYGNWDILIYEV